MSDIIQNFRKIQWVGFNLGIRYLVASVLIVLFFLAMTIAIDYSVSLFIKLL